MTLPLAQLIPTWKETESKQPYQSTNDVKNERIPVVAFGLFQDQGEAREMRDLWMQREDKAEYFVRSFERGVRVDTILTTAYCVVVRRRDQLVLSLDEKEDEEEQTDIETEASDPEPAIAEPDDDLPF